MSKSKLKKLIGKKGQLSLFVIVSLILLIAIVLILFLKNTTIKEFYNNRLKADTVTSDQLKALDNFVKECIKATGHEALILAGKQGGYLTSPSQSIQNIPYYFINNKSVMPSKNKIEKEISNYLDIELFFCTRNFVKFPNFAIIQEQSITTTTINDKSVIFNVKYPLIIYKNDVKYELSNFKVEVPIRLGVIHNVISEIIKDQVNNTDSICLSCITRLAEDNDLYIHLDNIDDKTILFTTKDESLLVNNGSYEFIFANRY